MFMEILKFKRAFLLVNILLIFIFFILFVSSLFISDKMSVYYIGIADRVILGIWCIFNGIWNACTDYYSIFKSNRFEKRNKTPQWAWWFVFIVGVGCIITASLGYGFNNVTKPM
jgi:hypothetical protein